MLIANEIVKEQMLQTTSKKALRSSEKQKPHACFEARTLPVNLKIYASYSLLGNQFNETFF